MADEKRPEIETVTMFYATDYYCECPYCYSRLDGFYGIPYGETDKCEFCGRTFKISDAADLEFGG